MHHFLFIYPRQRLGVDLHLGAVARRHRRERLLRDVRVWSVMEGSTEILRMIVSGNVLAQ